MTDLDAFLWENEVISRKRTAFGDASALYRYCFENDNGSVPQLAKLRAYVERWEELRQNNVGLLLWGLPGTGKTFAAACIANALCERGTDARMTTLGRVMNALPSMSVQNKLYYLDELKNCDLLILDDFGMERQTDYAQEQVFSIIDGRYLSRKPMIVTTNLRPQDMTQAKELMERRIIDRILEVCVPLCFDGPSLRQRKAEETKERLQMLTSR